MTAYFLAISTAAGRVIIERPSSNAISGDCKWIEIMTVSPFDEPIFKAIDAAEGMIVDCERCVVSQPYYK